MTNRITHNSLNLEAFLLALPRNVGNLMIFNLCFLIFLDNINGLELTMTEKKRSVGISHLLCEVTATNKTANNSLKTCCIL